MNQVTRLMRPLVLNAGRILPCTSYSPTARVPVRSLYQTDRCLWPQKFPSPYPDTRWLKLKRKLGRYALPKREMIGSSANLYVACTDNLDTLTFMKGKESGILSSQQTEFRSTRTEFELPDTYFSWMLMCRVMREGPEGQFLRDELCRRLWEDAAVRLKRLTRMKAGLRHEILVDLADHFRAFLLCMDEGLLADDKTMASALWRNMYGRQCPHPKYIEKWIQYLRTEAHQIAILPVTPASAIVNFVLRYWLVAGMATIPSSTFTASKVHQSIVDEQSGGNVVRRELIAPKYNGKLMNSIWGLYNRYAPPAFQKNNEPLSGTDCGDPASTIRPQFPFGTRLMSGAGHLH